MSSKDVYNAYYEASYANPPSSNVEAIVTYFSDDFQSLDKDGNVVMTKEAYTGMVQLLFAAFKDFKYVRSDLREEGEGVIALVTSNHFVHGSQPLPVPLGISGTSHSNSQMMG